MTTGAAHGPFLSGFVGRRQELREVRQLVEAHRLVTLLGVGGVGKTRLGYHVLGDLAPKLDGAAWAVDLSDLGEAALIGDAFAASLGVPAPGSDPDATVLVQHIGDRPALLYVDNCEHLLEASAGLIAKLLARCPGLRVLTSSRQSLGLLGEQAYPVPPMSPDDAARLFAERASSALPSWSLTPEAREPVAELCAAVERIPLAIELAAVQVRTFSPATMLARLRERGVVPGLPMQGEPARRASIEACVQWSFDLCTRQEQLLWSRLSVFAGGFSLDGVEASCDGDGLEQAEVLGALAGLVDKSLVERENSEPEGRYRMLEVIRQFGAARLEEAGRPADWRRRHRDYFLALAEHFDEDWIGPRQAGWMDRFRLEHVNLRLAFEFSVADPAEAPDAMRMCTVLEHYFASTGGGSEAVHWLRRAFAHGTGTARERASALRVGCFIAVLLGDLETASGWQDEMTVLADENDDEVIHAYTLYARSYLLAFQGEPAEGARLAVDGLELLHRLGDVSRESNLHFLRGMMLGWCDRPAEAAEAYQRCLDLTEPRGELWLTSYAMWGLGVDAFTTGNLDEAIRLERDALRVKADFGDQLGIGLTIEALAWVAAEQGRGKEAALLLGAAQAIWSTIGMTVAAMPYLSRRREEGFDKTGQLLSVAEFEDVFRRGREMPQEEAVAVGLGLTTSRRAGPDVALTRREREIADLLATGTSNRAIADRLVISVRTVETHVENILRKLGVESRAQVPAALSASRS